METVEYKGVEIQIRQDDFPFSPRTDCDNLGKMVCFHRDYDLGDHNDYVKSDYSSWEELKYGIIERESPILIIPLFLYDHSGITMNTTGFSCQWDSMQVGWIYVTAEACEKMGNDPEAVEELRKYLVAEVATYDDYISGNVYGYSIEHELLDDSCTGFFGYDHEKSGLLDEARACIDAALSSADKLTA